MADHHSPSEDFEDQSQSNSGVEDDQLDAMKYETVQRINELMYQDKMAVLVEVVNVTVKQLNIQKENEFLQKAIKKVMDEKEISEKKLLDEKQLLESIANVEAQGKSLIGKLSNEYELINAQVKSIRGVRTQLKSEIAMTRTSIESLSKRIVAMGEKANKQFMEYSSNMTGWNACKSELKAKIVGLQEQNESLRAAQDAGLANVETMNEKHQTEIRQLSDKITQMENEQQQERRVLEEQKTIISSLQNEKKESDEQYAQLKLTNERDLATMQEKLVASNNQITMLEKTCAVNEQTIHELNEKMRELEGENVALTNNKGCMQSEISNLNDQLKKKTDRIEELELQIKTQNAMPPKNTGPPEPAVVTAAFPFGKPSIVGNYRTPIDAPSKIKKVPDKKVASYDYSLMEYSYHHDNDLSIVPSSESSSCIAYEKP